ncbi:hypothetical protein LCGC14_2938000, partial [marine sediment metagenome]
RWHRHNFGMDIRLFEDDGEAALILAYTEGKPLVGKSRIESVQFFIDSPL